MYALQAMRPNDAYLYLGHAARSALAIGMNKEQVCSCDGLDTHRLRLTFWAIYALERLSSLYTGRPSTLHDDHIDAGYPEDHPDVPSEPPCTIPGADATYVRALAELGRLAEKITRGIYSPRQLRTIPDIAAIVATSVECDASLETLMRSLPPHLRFFDAAAPPGETWQEMQRAHLGMNFHLVRVLLHRPALTYASFFTLRAAAGESAATAFDLCHSIDLTVASAKKLIELASDLCCNRLSGIQDCGVAFFLVSASVTLLYDVLDPETSAAHAKASFTVVEKAVECLGKMQHIGPLTGKAVSMDVMHVAKDALLCRGEDFGLEQSFTDFFPWIEYGFHHRLTTPWDCVLLQLTLVDFSDEYLNDINNILFV